MQKVGLASEIAAEGRRLVTVGDREVAIFAVDGEWRAFENRCPHAGGPVCEGKIMPRVVAEVDEVRDVRRLHFSDQEFRIACPWHGWEFDIRTGESASDPRRRLRRFSVEEKDGYLYVDG